jgi:predicted RNase H-like HicB family nuclease
MQSVKIVVWQDGDAWIGYLQEYPDYWTQGSSLDDLREHLKDLHAEFSSGDIPGVRRLEDLIIS